MDETSAPVSNKSRRWTVISSGLLCGLLALVVIYTRPGAFYSPIAVMVVAAIGLAAVLLQLRFFNRQQTTPVKAPRWLNLLGVLFALLAMFGDVLHLSAAMGQMSALGAVAAFSISGTIILHAFRKRRAEK